MNEKPSGEGRRTDSSNSGGNSISIPVRVWLVLVKNKYPPSPFPPRITLYRDMAIPNTHEATVTLALLL